MAIGLRIGEALRPGMVVGLQGALGVGKTTLVKGLAQALGITEQITSPSFTIVSRYLGHGDGVSQDVELLHIDLYRTGLLQELEDIGLEELINRPGSDGKGIAVIEWSEKATPLLPQKSITVSIDLKKDGLRSIQVQGLVL